MEDLIEMYHLSIKNGIIGKLMSLYGGCIKQYILYYSISSNKMGNLLKVI